MGFCLSGVNYKDYKRVNLKVSLWWWDPFWYYVCENCMDILTIEQRKMGFQNHCATGLINQEQVDKIITRLEGLLSEGRVKEHESVFRGNISRYGNGISNVLLRIDEEENKELIDLLPYKFEESFVKKFINFAKDSGGFEIW